MKVFAIVVTYGDRYHLLEQSIDALFKQQVSRVIVVDNRSHTSSYEQLRNLEKNLRGKLKVIHLEENTGSAGGYKIGLQNAYACEDCKFIWLLDDDNRPKEGALNALIDFWQKLAEEDKEHRIALMSYREDREIYKEVILKNLPNLVIGRTNSFLGFHVCEIPAVLIRRIKKRYVQKLNGKDLGNKITGTVSAVPFGGMFFHKALLNEIGYPNQDLYLYSDDWDFSYRITHKGGKIIMLLNSVIEDLQKSWHRKNKESLFKIYLLDDLEDFRLYYYVRNRIYFEKKHLVTNPVIYCFNRLTLLSTVLIFGFIKKRNNLRIIKKAVRDGNKGELGRLS